jgi:hypothetical protein
MGAYRALRTALHACDLAGLERCALAPGSRAKYDKLAAALKAKPLDDGEGNVVLYSDLIDYSLGQLYSATDLGTLMDVVERTYDAYFTPSRPSTVRALAQTLRARSSRAGTAGRPVGVRGVAPLRGLPPAVDNFESFHAVTCTDTVNPTQPSAWPAAAKRRDAVAPYFGSAWTWGSEPCATWPGKDTDGYRGPWGAKTANPVLVIGTTQDPATRYEEAVSVSRLLPGAALVTLHGYGHTSGFSSLCVDQAVARYLLTASTTGLVTNCTQDFGPFDSGGLLIGSKEAAARAKAAKFADILRIGS